MKKKVLGSLVLISSAILFLAGCGGGSAKEEKADGPVDVEVWLTPQWKGVMDSTEEGADYDSFFKEAAKRYNEKNPDVNIKVQVIPGEQRSDKLSVAIQTKTLPDIFFDSSFALSEYAHMGVLEPLDDIIDDKTKGDIPESIWDNVQINDQTYFYPFGHNPGTLAYNADMLKEAGLEQYIGDEHEIKTWDLEEFKTILTTLKEKNSKVAPFGLYAKNNQGDTWNLSYMRMFGNEFFDKDGKIIVNEENGVEALSYLNELREKGLTTSGPESLTSNDVNAMFQNKQTAINFTNSVLFAGIQKDMNDGKVEKFDMRLANIPSESGNPISFTYVTSSVVFNTGDKAKTEAAKDFVKFYSTDSELVKASQNTLPVRDSVSKELAPDLPYLDAYNKNSEYIINFSNNAPGYAELRNAFFPELQAVFTGEKTEKEALDNFAEQGNRIIETNEKKSVILK
ncbi:sugar ABC transporter substrate-binding protein [Enterococcus sp. JM4C]|uniref:ABC transporter substrate-binding protein n=1 Tax=Candidatus Enterococcus huntleyi TaxID=1857217 RepID=UPI001379B92C|nr:extracellular solute-binding protein [Enterococcus sp. JM4C]KAF1297845.1 sugar ABC transporter substrate-binding protein [Enterococcus sp. JM4C]